VLKSYCIEKAIAISEETIEKESLDKLLQKLYPATKKMDGQLNSRISMSTGMACRNILNKN